VYTDETRKNGTWVSCCYIIAHVTKVVNISQPEKGGVLASLVIQQSAKVRPEKVKELFRNKSINHFSKSESFEPS